MNDGEIKIEKKKNKIGRETKGQKKTTEKWEEKKMGEGETETEKKKKQGFQG